jgi:hypothetical protein
LLGRLGYTLDDVTTSREGRPQLARPVDHESCPTNMPSRTATISVRAWTWMILAEQRGLLTLREERLVEKPDGLCLEVCRRLNFSRALVRPCVGIGSDQMVCPRYPQARLLISVERKYLDCIFLVVAGHRSNRRLGHCLFETSRTGPIPARGLFFVHRKIVYDSEIAALARAWLRPQ